MKKIIIYDFDGTLTPYPITKFKVLEKCGLKNGINDSKLLGLIDFKKSLGMETYEAIYSAFLEIIRESSVTFNDENISLGAEELEYNQGVVEYLSKVGEIGFKNYLISSGIKVLLEKTIVSKYFDEIYATTFNYDNELITDVCFLMSDKKKVDVIKKIMEENDLNDCSDIIYVGDGLTDLYAMEFVKNNGGVSIFVYLDDDNKELSIAKDNDFVSKVLFADYRENSELYNYIFSLSR